MDTTCAHCSAHIDELDAVAEGSRFFCSDECAKEHAAHDGDEIEDDEDGDDEDGDDDDDGDEDDDFDDEEDDDEEDEE